MHIVGLNESVRTVLKIADTGIEVDCGVSGVAVETVDEKGEFDGTLVYFPGYRAAEIGEILPDTDEDENDEYIHTTYKPGALFTDELGHTCVLAQVGYAVFAMIDLKSGNRLTDPQPYPEGAYKGLPASFVWGLSGSIDVTPISTPVEEEF